MVDGFNIGDRVRWIEPNGKVSKGYSIITKFFEVAIGDGKTVYYASTQSAGWLLVDRLVKINEE